MIGPRQLGVMHSHQNAARASQQIVSLPISHVQTGKILQHTSAARRATARDWPMSAGRWFTSLSDLPGAKGWPGSRAGAANSATTRECAASFSRFERRTGGAKLVGASSPVEENGSATSTR